MVVNTSNGVQKCFLRLFAPHEKSLGPKTKTQIGFLRLFTPHEKSLGPKNQNSSIIREKVRKWRFYCRFNGKYRQMAGK